MDEGVSRVGGGGLRGSGGLDVYDKGSHFLVSHFLGWRAGVGQGGVGEGGGRVGVDEGGGRVGVGVGG